MVEQQRGVIRCRVDYATDAACIEYDPRVIGKEKLYRQISDLGYGVDTLEESSSQAVEQSLLLRASVTAFFALNVMMLAYPLYAVYWEGGGTEYRGLFAYLSCSAALPVITYGAWPLYRRFYASWRSGFFGMETLIVISVVASVLLSAYHLWQGNYHIYLDSATAIVALVLIGKAVESRAKLSARTTLLRLVRLQPRRGCKLLPDGSCCYVPIAEITVGDILQVKAGEKNHPRRNRYQWAGQLR